MALSDKHLSTTQRPESKQIHGEQKWRSTSFADALETKAVSHFCWNPKWTN